MIEKKIPRRPAIMPVGGSTYWLTAGLLGMTFV